MVVRFRVENRVPLGAKSLSMSDVVETARGRPRLNRRFLDVDFEIEMMSSLEELAASSSLLLAKKSVNRSFFARPERRFPILPWGPKPELESVTPASSSLDEFSVDSEGAVDDDS